MRVSVVIGQTRSGGWEALALPDKDIEGQKALVKSLIAGRGRIGLGRGAKAYKQVLRFDSYTKRARFDEVMPAPVSESPVAV